MKRPCLIRPPIISPQWQRKSTTPTLYDLCAIGLAHIAQNLPTYDKLIILTRPFLEEILHESKALEQTLQKEIINDPQAIAFQLFESSTLVLREVSLRSQQMMAKDVEALFDYFEQSGLWPENDRTIAAQYYHVLIPQNVAREKPDNP